MLRLVALVLLAATPTLAGGWGDATAVWRLMAIDGKPFGATATLHFPAEGGIQGEGPCNSFRADLAGDYPGFILGPVLATRMACPDQQEEASLFAALGAMEHATFADGKLLLTGPEGRSMEFQPD